MLKRGSGIGRFMGPDWTQFVETVLPWLLVPLIAGSFMARTFVFSLTGLEHRVGLFELTIGLLLAGLVFLLVRRRWPVRWHLLNLIIGLMVVAGLFSSLTLVLDVYYPYSSRLAIMLQQLAGLVLFFLFSVALFNLFVTDPQIVGSFLRIVVVVNVFMVAWLIADQLTHSSYLLFYVGPFDFKRALLGLHMLSIFWLTLLALFWPDRPAWERVLCFAALLLTVYAIVVAGRRSIYVAFAIGFIGLVAGVAVVHSRDRWRLGRLLAVIGALVLVAYLFGDLYFTQFDLFKYKLAQLTSYIAIKSEGGTSWEDPFLSGQIDGALAAFGDHPLFGIGWGGFHESIYSPGGFEMHGTPQKFLAEMGLVGLLLYLAFTAYLMLTSLVHFFRLRRTRWGLPALILALAMWSLPISYLYNRMLTDRAFWLLVAVYLGFEVIVHRQKPTNRWRTAEVESAHSDRPQPVLVPANSLTTSKVYAPPRS